MAQRKKQTVLIFIDWYSPGYKAGGQIPSVSNLVKLIENDYEIYIITSDADLGDKQSYSSVLINCWNSCGKIKIYYSSAINLKLILKIFQSIKPDIIYFNSLFSWHFTILPLLILRISGYKSRIFLAPRGMLGKGALKQKFIKKKTFIFLAKSLSFFKDITWHSSSELEANEIRLHFGQNSKIKIALDLSTMPNNFSPTRINLKQPGKLTLFFLSRITPKKNLHFSLKLLLHIKTNQIAFHIIGPVEDKSYWNECTSIIERLPQNIKVTFIGELSPTNLQRHIYQHGHFLFFPTLHENYGHVVFESLALGCPVIISDSTPWKDLRKKGIGWDLPLQNPERFVEVIEYCARMGQEEYDAMSRRAYEYAKRITEDPAIIEANRKLFE